MLLTACVVALAKGSDSVGNALLENPWLLVPTMVVFVVTALMPICCRKLGRKVPLNYIILFTFVRCKQTLCASILVAYSCLNFDTSLVIAAGLLTILVTASLVLSVLVVSTTQCAADFRISSSLLVMTFMSSLAWMVISLCLPGTSWLQTGCCALGALLFGIYILIDVAIIMDGGKYGISNDDYVFCAMLVYLDMVNLFLQLLQLLARLRDS